MDGSYGDGRYGRNFNGFVGWEEVVMSNDKGRRVLHYYLKLAGEGADLAVVGREKSARHMCYAVPEVFKRSMLRRGVTTASEGEGLGLRWKSRREVIDWLSSLVKGAKDSNTYDSSPVVNRYMDSEDAKPIKLPNSSKGVSSQKLVYDYKAFLWLGPAWTCRKRRNHYRSFSRNGFIIKVHDFVYIMGEENKRLVAYIEDLYEDMKGSKMVVVRWFHKVDEIGTLLPPDVNDREIFFSLCLQHLRVECIDGLASILSAQHFKQFLNDGRPSKCEPYLCRRQIDNDEAKPFDITQVQGYWSQELLRSLFTSPLKLRFKIKHGSSDVAGSEKAVPDSSSRSKLPLQLSQNSLVEKISIDESNFKHPKTSNISEKRSTLGSSVFLRKERFKHKFQPQLSHGCHVEVLSQDSGLRGCWFHCVVLKRHGDKIKVRYQDLKNFDETENLEEWVSLSRIASPDKFGIRMRGRAMVRPYRTHRGMNWNMLDIGANVDAWWHDGWWEGILISKQDGMLQVYFPGEGSCSIFSHNDVRESQDWVNDKWNLIESKKDVATLLSISVNSNKKSILNEVDPMNREISNAQCCGNPSGGDKFQDDCTTSPESSVEQEDSYRDLTKDLQLNSLKWNPAKKRKRGKELAKNTPENNRSRKSSGRSCNDSYTNFLLQNVDQENCKVGGDSIFSAPMSLSSLVMSQ